MQNRFKEFRKTLKLNQEELANKLEIPYQTISKYERGENKPSADVLTKLGEKCNLNIDWLLTGRGEMFINNESNNITTIELTKGQILKVISKD